MIRTAVNPFPAEEGNSAHWGGGEGGGAYSRAFLLHGSSVSILLSENKSKPPFLVKGVSYFATGGTNDQILSIDVQRTRVKSFANF